MPDMETYNETKINIHRYKVEDNFVLWYHVYVSLKSIILAINWKHWFKQFDNKWLFSLKQNLPHRQRGETCTELCTAGQAGLLVSPPLGFMLSSRWQHPGRGRLAARSSQATWRVCRTRGGRTRPPCPGRSTGWPCLQHHPPSTSTSVQTQSPRSESASGSHDSCL